MSVVLPEQARRCDMLRSRGEELIRLRAKRHDLATELEPVNRKRARLLAKIEAIDLEIEALDRA